MSSTQKQIASFKEQYKLLVEAGFEVKWKHIGASAGMFQLQDEFFTAWRPGIALYGYSSLGKQKES